MEQPGQGPSQAPGETIVRVRHRLGWLRVVYVMLRDMIPIFELDDEYLRQQVGRPPSDACATAAVASGDHQADDGQVLQIHFADSSQPPGSVAQCSERARASARDHSLAARTPCVSTAQVSAIIDRIK